MLIHFSLLIPSKWVTRFLEAKSKFATSWNIRHMFDIKISLKLLLYMFNDFYFLFFFDLKDILTIENHLVYSFIKHSKSTFSSFCSLIKTMAVHHLILVFPLVSIFQLLLLLFSPFNALCLPVHKARHRT